MINHDLLILLGGSFFLAANLLGAGFTLRGLAQLRRAHRFVAGTAKAETYNGAPVSHAGTLKASPGIRDAEDVRVWPSESRPTFDLTLIDRDERDFRTFTITSYVLRIGRTEVPLSDIQEAGLLKRQYSRTGRGHVRVWTKGHAANPQADVMLQIRFGHAMLVVSQDDLLVRNMLREVQDAMSQRDPSKNVTLNVGNACIDLWTDEYPEAREVARPD